MSTNSDGSMVVFGVGGELYAIPTTAAREVIGYQEPRPLPGSDAWVRGVINLRGEIVPVCDLAEALGLGAVGTSETIIVADTSRGSVGCIVDEVIAVATVTDEDVEPVPSIDHQAVRGIIKRDGRLIIVLDLEPIVSGQAQGLGASLTAIPSSTSEVSADGDQPSDSDAPDTPGESPDAQQGVAA